MSDLFKIFDLKALFGLSSSTIVYLLDNLLLGGVITAISAWYMIEKALEVRERRLRTRKNGE